MEKERKADAIGQGIGQRLLSACRDVGLESQSDISREFKVSNMTVSCWVRGIKSPPIKTGVKIAKRTGVCVEWLYTGNGPRYPEPPKPLIQLAQEFEKAPPKLKEFIRSLLKSPGEHFT